MVPEGNVSWKLLQEGWSLNLRSARLLTLVINPLASVLEFIVFEWN
jgi:hypothetical protein